MRQKNENISRGLLLLFSLLGMLGGGPRVAAQQKRLSGYERDLAHSMLKNILEDVRKHYYDPAFRNVDLNGRFREADQKIDQATSFNRVFIIISWALDVLKDSHTYFVPPPRPSRYEYGFRSELVGTRCLVTAVKPGSDAERKGLKLGDVVVSLDGYILNRDTFYDLQKLFGSLVPQDSLSLTLLRADGSTSNLTIQAEVQVWPKTLTVWGANVRDLPKRSYAWYTEHRSRSSTIGPDLMIWKMSAFLSEEDLSKELGEVKKFKALIVDLRGNSGGGRDVLTQMVSSLFDHDVKIGERETRNGNEDWIVKTRGSRAFTGRLAVLIDSGSASASEILARTVQIEKRGTVIGDRSAGMVGEAKIFPYRSSPDRTQIILYAAAINEAGLVMADGNRLEGIGVTPDETRLVTSKDLSAGRDPVLSRAAELLGVTLTPEDASKLFPVTWPTPKLE